MIWNTCLSMSLVVGAMCSIIMPGKNKKTKNKKQKTKKREEKLSTWS